MRLELIRFPLSLAPDGRWFLVQIQDLRAIPTRIHVVQNWFEELKAKCARAMRRPRRGAGSARHDSRREAPARAGRLL